MEFNYHQAISTVEEYFEEFDCCYSYYTSSNIGDDSTVFCAEAIREYHGRCDHFTLNITVTQSNIQYRAYPGITIPDAYLPMGCIVLARFNHEYADGAVKIDPETGTVYAQINSEYENGISVDRLLAMEQSVINIIACHKRAILRVAGGLPSRSWADCVYGGIIISDEEIAELDDHPGEFEDDAE